MLLLEQLRAEQKKHGDETSETDTFSKAVSGRRVFWWLNFPIKLFYFDFSVYPRIPISYILWTFDFNGRFSCTRYVIILWARADDIFFFSGAVVVFFMRWIVFFISFYSSPSFFMPPWFSNKVFITFALVAGSHYETKRASTKKFIEQSKLFFNPFVYFVFVSFCRLLLKSVNKTFFWRLRFVNEIVNGM